MNLLLSEDQVINIWKIRCKGIKQFRRFETLFQSFIFMLVVSAFLLVTLDFVVTSKGFYIILNAILLISNLIILIFLRLVASDRKNLLTVFYDLLFSLWFSYILFEVGFDQASKQLSGDMFANYITVNIILISATVVFTTVFSGYLLQKKIQLQNFGKKDGEFNTKFLRFLPILIGSIAGFSLLLSNLEIYDADFKTILLLTLVGLVMCLILFFSTLSLIELLYFLIYVKPTVN